MHVIRGTRFAPLFFQNPCARRAQSASLRLLHRKVQVGPEDDHQTAGLTRRATSAGEVGGSVRSGGRTVINRDLGPLGHNPGGDAELHRPRTLLPRLPRRGPSNSTFEGPSSCIAGLPRSAVMPRRKSPKALVQAHLRAPRQSCLRGSLIEPVCSGQLFG
jgi:hypothetical protein